MVSFGHMLRTIAAIAALSCALVLALLPIAPADTMAQPPPTTTAIPPITDVPPTDAPPTDVPPTDVPPTDVPPTDVPPTDVPPTDVPPTDVPPTDVPPTDVPPTGVPPTDVPPTAPPPQASATTGPAPTGKPKPQPGCDSTVEGYVLGAGGKRQSGSTVRIGNSGYSNQMMTDDNGRYGFGSLCAGTYNLQATLPGGQLTAIKSVTVTGHDTVHADLSLAAATGTPTVTRTVQPASTTEPDMPTTGYPGWLLVGGALLGTLLLLSAGARRLFRRG